MDVYIGPARGYSLTGELCCTFQKLTYQGIFSFESKTLLFELLAVLVLLEASLTAMVDNEQ